MVLKVGTAIQQSLLPFPWQWCISQNWSKMCSWCHFSQTGNSPLQRDDFLLTTHRQKQQLSSLLFITVATVLTENRSSVLGPTTMRGLRKLRIICLLSRWKYWAGVVGLTTAMFTLSPSTPSSWLSHICQRKTKKCCSHFHTSACKISKSPTKDVRKHTFSMQKQKKIDTVDWTRVPFMLEICMLARQWFSSLFPSCSNSAVHNCNQISLQSSEPRICHVTTMIRCYFVYLFHQKTNKMKGQTITAVPHQHLWLHKTCSNC